MIVELVGEVGEVGFSDRRNLTPAPAPAVDCVLRSYWKVWWNNNGGWDFFSFVSEIVTSGKMWGGMKVAFLYIGVGVMIGGCYYSIFF